MKALAHWAIHRQQKIHIAGHAGGAIWGRLVALDGTVRSFRFDQATLRLTLGEGDAGETLQLDPYGFELPLEQTDGDA